MTSSTTQYLVLIPGDESSWDTKSADEKSLVYDAHREFGELLAERGHRVVHAAELEHSSTARIVRSASDGSSAVTAGPYAESVEQLTGFYLVESADLDDLVQVCAVLARGEGAVEIRETVDHSQDGASS
ncbi:unannotated protein [freshwater metagenome]|uniref:Unannotated protein n=1 Tax=freshwater metagenome TaxID=449393 RepID=A0A6J6RDW2_9ZZZZ